MICRVKMKNQSLKLSKMRRYSNERKRLKDLTMKWIWTFVPLHKVLKGVESLKLIQSPRLSIIQGRVVVIFLNHQSWEEKVDFVAKVNQLVDQTTNCAGKIRLINLTSRRTPF
jgi:hypothetical protein